MKIIKKIYNFDHLSYRERLLTFLFLLPIPYTISYTVVCGVSQLNPYNKDENNNSIISIISTT